MDLETPSGVAFARHVIRSVRAIVVGTRTSGKGDRVKPKRVVVWGTGFVGRMVIPEVVRHPAFELVGVGVHSPEKSGRDVGEICGVGAIGLAATDDVEQLIALAPDALVHYGPTAAQADENIRLIARFLRAGIDVCSTAMTPWVWPTMAQNPPSWIDPITQACAEGGASCFTTGIDPGFANDLFPMTLMGLCSEVRSVHTLELLDYTNYEGDYEQEMGIGRPPEYVPLLEHTDILVMSWGATVPMIAHAAGIELSGITTTWKKWVTQDPIQTAKGVVEPGCVAAIHFTINGMVGDDVRIALEHVNRVGAGSAPDWPCGPRTTSTASRSKVRRRSARRPPSGSPTAPVAMLRRPAVSATGLRASNAVPAVNDLPSGWVTALDLPLIPGFGTIR